MSEFDDIRPYSDGEVAAVIQRLITDPELIATLASWRMPGFYRWLPWLLTPLVKARLRREFAQVSSVRQFQQRVKVYMDQMIESTTERLTVSGLDQLDPEMPYLFVSNHRDITLDPAFVNYALYHNGHDTVRIAIGDNLLSKPFVSDLMRLNKSFIVKRSARGPRQMLATYRTLSSYIRRSIEQDRNPIWIAQREGRAKNGIDRTEPAIIKMLAMSMDKTTETLSAHINRLNLVPVAISYEFDPCDGAKARELHARASTGSYQKAEHEDVTSIALGITGNKGHVHVAFGQPLRGEWADPDQVAAAVDRQIIGHYLLHPTNYFAYKLLNGHYPEGALVAEQQALLLERRPEAEKAFRQRIDALPEAHRPLALDIYSNPVLSKLQLGTGDAHAH